MLGKADGPWSWRVSLTKVPKTQVLSLRTSSSRMFVSRDGGAGALSGEADVLLMLPKVARSRNKASITPWLPFPRHHAVSGLKDATLCFSGTAISGC